MVLSIHNVCKTVHAPGVLHVQGLPAHTEHAMVSIAFFGLNRGECLRQGATGKHGSSPHGAFDLMLLAMPNLAEREHRVCGGSAAALTVSRGCSRTQTARCGRSRSGSPWRRAGPG